MQNAVKNMIKDLKIKKNKENAKEYFIKIWEKVTGFMARAKVLQMKICDDCHTQIICYPENQMAQRYYVCNVNHYYGLGGSGLRKLCMYCGNIDAINQEKQSYVSVSFAMFLI